MEVLKRFQNYFIWSHGCVGLFEYFIKWHFEVEDFEGAVND
jgi:hypothetical protein